MAKHNELKGALDYLRKNYSKGDSAFKFTVNDLASGIDVSEKKAKDIVKRINTRAQFWRGNFEPRSDDYIVSPQVFDRIKDWFK